MTSPQDSGDDTLSAVLGALCIGLLAAGAGAGTTLWAPISTAVRGWFGTYRRYRALTPLWGELRAVLPEIRLIPPRGQFGPSQVHFALYRRVIEIQDARMILRHYTDPRTFDWLAEATRRFPPAAEQVSLIAEAASLTGASNARPSAPSRHPPTPMPPARTRSTSCWRPRPTGSRSSVSSSPPHPSSPTSEPAPASAPLRRPAAGG
ncbi:MAB_1171c family putative transporter [Streptomyces sp. NPDC006739]|uniref:MAB_1171c family putative transporter n=1 Tax=Streptomyces sp. NPDC006739 TaxID=3364763 RepID=UPI00368853D8